MEEVIKYGSSNNIYVNYYYWLIIGKWWKNKRVWVENKDLWII